MDTEVTQEDNGAVIRVSGVLSGDTADEFVTILRTTLAYNRRTSS